MRISLFMSVLAQSVLLRAHLPSTIQTESLPPSAAQTILNQQRLRRPSSPHFTIYQPQLTWLSSIANRVTGSGLSGCSYLIFPVLRLYCPR